MNGLMILLIVVTILNTIILTLGIVGVLNELRRKNNLSHNQPIIAPDDYKEDDIIAHLDYIVTQAIDNYVLFNVSAKQAYYINSKTEKEMIEKLQETIPEQISGTLLNKLCYIYNPSYVGTFLGEYIYMKITDFVINYNLQNSNYTNK
jgi:hypothetical protein